MKEIVELSLASLHGRKSVRLECYIIDKIAHLECADISEDKQTYRNINQVYFSDFYHSQNKIEVDSLVGAKFLWEFQLGDSGKQYKVA